MPSVLSAGAPLEPQGSAVGRSSTLLVDASRDDRLLPLDCWYPTLDGDGAVSEYELLPGIVFTASAFADAVPASGPYPLIVFSHGRLGTRSSYAMLCEGLAARGYIVVAPDHPGDTLADWTSGTAVDDATNEAQRVDDVRFILDAVLEDRSGLVAVTGAKVDQIAIAGHSYGAYTAFAYAGAEPVDDRIRAVAGMESFTRTMAASIFSRVTAPSLLIAGAHDTSCPPETDTGPAFAALGSDDARRVDIEHAGHQACSDVGLYLELAPQVEGIPDVVNAFLQTLTDQVTGTPGDPWRPTVGLHLRLLGAWLDDVFDRDATRARRELDQISALPGITMEAAPVTTR